MRIDIKCLRGISIILVFVYHLFPTIFVNGFLGVDIFFVISGYLMAKNLTRNKLQNLTDIFKFYYRRFRRILPLYYLVIFITLVLVHLYLGDFWWYINRRYSLASLFLVTNQLVIHDQADYFKEFLADDNAPNAFIHLWSLGVEMQYYLLVPFIFFGFQFLKNDLLRLIVVFLTTLIGFVCFVSINQQFAFNFMFLRLWQFSAGFIALFWNKANFYEHSEKLKPEKTRIIFPIGKEDMVTLSLSIIWLCVLPNEINVLFLRPFVTLATSFIIANDSRENQLLNSKSLCYIGDISYVIYLVHWPVIAIFLTSTLKSYLFCTMITLLASIVLHHLFEKQYLKLGWKLLIPLFVLLIFSNAYLQYSVRKHNFWNNTYPLEVQKIVDQNKMMLPDYWTNHPSTNECVEKGYGFYGDSLGSYQALDIFKYEIEKYKPDVLFITARYAHSIRAPIRANDSYVQQMNENVKFYEKFVKKIYVLDSLPLYRVNFLNVFLQYAVQRPDELESLHLKRQKADEQMRYVKKRFSMIKCKKCYFYDLSHVLMEDDKYLAFDRDTMLSYIDNNVHTTAAGIELFKPVFKKIGREIMDTI